MSARQRYAGLSARSRRAAARHVRKALDADKRTQQRLDVWAEMALDGLIHDGEVDTYWLYCWELGSRVKSLRDAAGVVDGAR